MTNARQAKSPKETITPATLKPLFTHPSTWLRRFGTSSMDGMTISTGSDIDILIAPADRRPAAQVLIDAGYRVHAEPAIISHEATFSRGAVDIDLHWHMVRPGRTRVDLTAELLARRQRIKGQWGLSDLRL